MTDPTNDVASEEALENGSMKLTGKQKMAVARAAKAFSSYGEARKSMAKIAKAIVNLRLSFEKEGRPDYRGETPQYRGTVASLYEAAIEDPDERESFKIAIRYWVAKEFAARVEAGELKHDDLVAAGLNGQAQNASANSTDGRASPRKEDEQSMVTDLLAEAEATVERHVADDTLGPVTTLQHVGRELGPIVSTLRNPEIRDKLPGRALRQSAEQLLTMALDAAALSGVEIDDFIAGWEAHQLELEAVAA